MPTAGLKLLSFLMLLNDYGCGNSDEVCWFRRRIMSANFGFRFQVKILVPSRSNKSGSKSGCVRRLRVKNALDLCFTTL